MAPFSGAYVVDPRHCPVYVAVVVLVVVVVVLVAVIVVVVVVVVVVEVVVVVVVVYSIDSRSSTRHCRDPLLCTKC